MAFDVARVRGAYTSITGGWTYMNAQQQAQIPERVAAAVARGFRNSPIVEDVEPAFGSHARERHAGLFASDGYERSARVAIADLTGTSADAVILGPKLEVLFSQFAAAVWPLVRRGSSVVMAHGCSPAMTVGAKTRWAQPDLGTGRFRRGSSVRLSTAPRAWWLFAPRIPKWARLTPSERSLSTFMGLLAHGCLSTPPPWPVIVPSQWRHWVRTSWLSIALPSAAPRLLRWLSAMPRCSRVSTPTC